MRNVALFVAAVLVCGIAIQPAFSEDDHQQGDSQQAGNQQGNDNQENGNHQGDNQQGDDNRMHLGGYSNQTLLFYRESNKTISLEGDSNATNIGQLISDFVHKRNELVKEQRDQAVAAIKDCRKEIRISDNRTATILQCKAEFQTIHNQFLSDLVQLQTQFKQFRQSLISSSAVQLPDQNRQVLYNIINNLSHTQHNRSNHGD